jgi:hypothetical protein
LKTPPPSLINSKGRLTPSVINLLQEHFGFSAKSIKRTVYRQIRFHKSAITWYNHVFYDAKCLQKNELEWLLLIIHEQVHRNEIGNSFFKATAWYVGYLAGFVKAGFSYRKNEYEIKAYDIEKSATELFGRMELPFLQKL